MFGQDKGSSITRVIPCARANCEKPAIGYSDFCWNHLRGYKPEYLGFLCDLAVSKGLRAAYLVGITMPGVDLSRSTVIDSDISNSSLARSKFQQATISNCSFRGSNLRDSDFNHSRLIHNDFAMCRLRGTSFWGCDLSNSSFKGATLSETIFKKANLDGANFEDIRLLSLRSYLWEAAKGMRRAAFSYGIYWRYGQPHAEQSIFESLTTFKKRVVLILDSAEESLENPH